jgi:hypothetical protein
MAPPRMQVPQKQQYYEQTSHESDAEEMHRIIIDQGLYAPDITVIQHLTRIQRIQEIRIE